MEAAAERACRATRLPQRGHVRVPARARRLVLLHRAERAAPGRAPGHASSSPGSTSCASSCASPPASRSRSTGRAPRRGPRDRGAHQRRGPGARLRAVAGPARALPRRRSGRASASTRIVEEGASIPPYYDSLIAKVIVWDETRQAAIARALRALGELEVAGVPTTRDARGRHPPQPTVPGGRLLDGLPRGGGAAALAVAGMSRTPCRRAPLGGSTAAGDAPALVVDGGGARRGRARSPAPRGLDVELADGRRGSSWSSRCDCGSGAARRRRATSRNGWPSGAARCAGSTWRRGRLDRGARPMARVGRPRGAPCRRSSSLPVGPDRPAAGRAYEGEPDEFARGLAEAVLADADGSTARITEGADGWTADRLGRSSARPADRVHELEEGAVPPEVAITRRSCSRSATPPTRRGGS